MGEAGESRMTVAPAEEARRRSVAAVSRSLRVADHRCRRRGAALSTGLPTIVAEMQLPARTPRGAGRRAAGAASAQRAAVAGAGARQLCAVRTCGPGQGNVDDDGRRAPVERPAQGPTLGPRIVPIVADEARTFGMANLFRQIGIYAPRGQQYEPEDAGSMLYYREAQDGQLLEEGITEAGALASWTAAATSYSVHGQPMLPFYIYYSMFGFQRVGDLIWAAADQRARGFLLGATAGRTTLGGEGLQHQDGSSHVMAATVPNCRAYDPRVRLRARCHRRSRHAADAGAAGRRVLLHHRDERELRAAFASRRRDDGIVRGMYRLGAHGEGTARCGCSAAARSCAKSSRAAEMLARDWSIASEVFSVTSFSELARDARDVERWNRLHPAGEPRRSHVAALLGATRRSSPPPITSARIRSSSLRTCARRSRRWAPTASGAATRASHFASSSRSTASTSW